MAQYTMTKYTMTEDSCRIITINDSNKKQNTDRKNLLPVPRPFELHNCTKETRCQARILPLIILHPLLTACRICVWLSTRSLAIFGPNLLPLQVVLKKEKSDKRTPRPQKVMTSLYLKLALTYQQTCKKRTNDLKRTTDALSVSGRMFYFMYANQYQKTTFPAQLSFASTTSQFV